MKAPTPVRRVVRAVFGIAAVAFLVIAFRKTLARAEGPVFPSPAHLAAGFVLMLAAMSFWARGWRALFDHPDHPGELTRGFYAGQIAKYIPGAVWQPARQLVSARQAGASLPAASAALVVAMVVQAIAAATLGAGLAFDGELPAWVRILAAAGLVAVLLLKRGWMVLALRLVSRALRRELSRDALPGQPRVIACFASTLVAMATSAGAFAVLSSSVDSTPPAFRLLAFSLAWGAGFVAVPFPSGLGVREAALLALLGRGNSSAALIAASVAHRLCSMGAEAVAVALSTLAARRKRMRRDAGIRGEAEGAGDSGSPTSTGVS
jgi:uncharacterized membrane protein YbhN (UPF0104 family)